MPNLKERMINRLYKRKTFLEKELQRLLDLIHNDKIGGEEDRIWLDNIAVGFGFDLCTGDFTIGDAVGVDRDRDRLGTDFCIHTENLASIDNEKADYIVTNYLEVFPNTLAILRECYRVLKFGGKIGIVCRDAESYSNPEGPLSNQKRFNIFTKITICQFLSKAGFCDIIIEKGEEKSLRVRGTK